jgi:hypothetical protein
VSALVRLGPGESKTDLRLVVPPATAVSGRVVECGSHRPLAGIHVEVSGDGPSHGSAETGVDGAFSVRGVGTTSQLHVGIAEDSTLYVAETKALVISPGEAQVEAGTINLLRGNLREKFSASARVTPVGWQLEPTGGRVLVEGVAGGSPADMAGLRAGTALLSIDGVPVADLGRGALTYLGVARVGERIDVVVATAEGARPATVVARPSPERAQP